MGNKYLDSIVQMALIENADNVKKTGKRGVEKTTKSCENLLFYKHVIDLRDEPVSLEKFQNFDPNVRSTQGFYQITFLPKSSKRYIKGKPFFINQDLLRVSLHVNSKRDWHLLCKKIPELGWLERNSTLTDDLFDVAANHAGMGFIFTVNWVEYGKMIEEKAKKRGINIDGHPFVTYKCSCEKQEEYDNTYFLAPKKDWKELQPIVEEVDRELLKQK